MARHKNANWTINEKATSWEEVNTAVLMDIRDELQTLNRVMACPNVSAGFIALRQIARDVKRLDRRAPTKLKLK